MPRGRLYHGAAEAAGLAGDAPQFPCPAPPADTTRRFTVPAGTPCAVRNVTDNGRDPWQTHTTTRAAAFDRFSRWVKDETGNYFEFRAGHWIMLRAAANWPGEDSPAKPPVPGQAIPR